MKIQLKPIYDQVVVLMGASSGIGRQAALTFAQRGAKVVVAARNREALDTLVSEIQADGGQALAVTADVSKYEQVKAVADQTVLRFGRIDTWINLAAVSVYSPFEEMQPEEFKRVIEVNLLGQAYGDMVAIPQLKATGQGALIHISSVEARVAYPLTAAYTASKHGLQGMIEALRMEIKQANLPISITNIMPASINTPLFDHARTRLGVKPRPLPPVYDVNVAVEAILYAAEHPVEEITAGGAGKLFFISQRFSPSASRAAQRKLGFAGQYSDQPKAPGDGDNLFDPMPESDRIQGDFADEAMPFSAYTWLITHPTVRTALLGGLVGGLAFASTMVFRRIKG